MDQWSGRQASGKDPIRIVKRKKKSKDKDSLRDFWGNIKHTNISIIGFLEGEEREKEKEKLLEAIMAENTPKLVKGTDIQV